MNGILKYNAIKCCITLAFLALCISSAFATQQKYQDDKILFYYPDDWELSIIKNHKIEIRLRPMTWLAAKKSSEYEIEDFALYILLSQDNFRKALESAGLIFEQGKWRIDGIGELEEIKGRNWKGLIVKEPKRLYYKEAYGGVYAGLGDDELTVIITDGNTSATISGQALGDKVGKTILQSLEFIHKK